MDLKDTAKYINVLGNFCGKRDIDNLSQAELKCKFGIEKVDIAILFGGSIIAGGDVLAETMQKQLAKKYMIVGGAGHTTQTLRDTIKSLYPDLNIVNDENLSEAECFARYLNLKYKLTVDLLETKSTNCGNNITFCLDMLAKNGIAVKSILFIQDSTMQHRMEAGFRKYLADDVKLINYASYKVEVVVKEGELTFAQDILGMWNLNRYISLLMGEIPRLSDDENGYGPKGKDFIATVDIPTEVIDAYNKLKNDYGNLIRIANDKYKNPN